MFIKQFLDSDALTFSTFEEAAAVQKILVENGYCVLMSREEHLWLLNWVWTSTPADRNEVIFISREIYECEEWEWLKKHPEYMEEED